VKRFFLNKRKAAPPLLQGSLQALVLYPLLGRGALRLV